MAKKKKVSTGDCFARMNFLYQAANLVHSESLGLERYYNNMMKKVQQKLVLRCTPELKRTICKSCNSLLIPCETSRVRLKSKRYPHFVVSCKTCGYLKRYNVTKGRDTHFYNIKFEKKKETPENEEDDEGGDETSKPVIDAMTTETTTITTITTSETSSTTTTTTTTTTTSSENESPTQQQ